MRTNSIYSILFDVGHYNEIRKRREGREERGEDRAKRIDERGVEEVSTRQGWVHSVKQIR